MTALLLHAAVLELLPATARTRIVPSDLLLGFGLARQHQPSAGGTGGLALGTSAAFLPVSFSRANSHNYLGVALKFLHPLPVLFLLGLLDGKPLVVFGKPFPGTEQEISSGFEHLEGDTKDVGFLVSILQVRVGVVSSVSFPKSTLHAWVCFLVSILRRAPMNRL